MSGDFSPTINPAWNLSDKTSGSHAVPVPTRSSIPAVTKSANPSTSIGTNPLLVEEFASEPLVENVLVNAFIKTVSTLLDSFLRHAEERFPVRIPVKLIRILSPLYHALIFMEKEVKESGITEQRTPEERRLTQVLPKAITALKTVSEYIEKAMPFIGSKENIEEISIVQHVPLIVKEALKELRGFLPYLLYVMQKEKFLPPPLLFALKQKIEGLLLEFLEEEQPAESMQEETPTSESFNEKETVSQKPSFGMPLEQPLQKMVKEEMGHPVMLPSFIEEETLLQPSEKAAEPLPTRHLPVISLLRTYPFYIPPIVEGFVLPIFPYVGMRRPVLAPWIEQMRQQNEFSTAIPFAFIVPYTPASVIHTNSASTRPLGKIPQTEEGVLDEEGGGEEEPPYLFVYVDKGETLYGDPFSEGSMDERPLRKMQLAAFAIGVYPVTVMQFIAYLNHLARAGEIKMDTKGRVYSLQGALLCQTKVGNAESPIETEALRLRLGFLASKGKEHDPVTCVSYLGAEDFCRVGQFRLPREMEWEKAASVHMENGLAVYKYRYGFSEDVIDPTYANYNSGYADGGFNGMIAPVGCYNGSRMFVRQGRSFATADAKSPFGCYDMSGNVAEWVAADAKGMTKGGHFQSRAFDLRVSARELLDPMSCLSTVGFRVACT